MKTNCTFCGKELSEWKDYGFCMCDGATRSRLKVHLVNDIRDYLIPLEKKVTENEQEFLKRFAKYFTDLISISFSSEDVEFVALSNSGEHVRHHITFDQFADFLVDLRD